LLPVTKKKKKKKKQFNDNNRYATGSEDMDSLAFGSPVIVRHLAFHQDVPPLQITLDDVLSSLNLTNYQVRGVKRVESEESGE
jgi:XPG I-region